MITAKSAGTRIAAAVLSAAMIATLSVASAPAAAAASAGTASSSAGSAPAPGGGHKGRGHRGCMGEHMAMRALAQLTGTEPHALAEKYPQKTAWQIAKQMGKLDALKKAVLAAGKEGLDRMVSEGRLTAAERDRMFEDLGRRVAAIDGVNTVVLGRPAYRPEKKAGGR